MISRPSSLRACAAALALCGPLACSSQEPLWASTTLTIPVIGSLTASASASALSVVQGGSLPFTLTLTPAGGFSGVVQFSPVGAQAGVTFLPESVDITGSAPVVVPMTLYAADQATLGTLAVTLAAASSNQVAQVALSVTVTAATPAPIASAPSSLALFLESDGGDAGQSFTISEANYSGAFTESDDCAGIATVAQTSPGTFSAAPVAVGSCAAQIADGFGQTLAVPISVSAD